MGRNSKKLKDFYRRERGHDGEKEEKRLRKILEEGREEQRRERGRLPKKGPEKSPPFDKIKGK